MQKCPECGKDVQYVANIIGTTYCVEVEETVIATEKGRLVKGFRLHKCRGQNGEKKEDK